MMKTHKPLILVLYTVHLLIKVASCIIVRPSFIPAMWASCWR